VLKYINCHLFSNYTSVSEAFVTAFYAVYSPTERVLTYSSAGHNAPRLKRCVDDTIYDLDEAGGLPLGVDADSQYDEATLTLQRGDQLIFYTDGITEGRNPRGEQFGTDRLDQALADCTLQAQALLDAILQSLETFTEGHPADDDRTLIVARVS
jgi:sigma-B regulation protein RsbU (phosphoserine phosphatase)